MEGNVLDVPVAVANAFRIFRTKNGQPDVINGANLSAAVQDGSLVISSGGEAIYIYSPGQWITVNANPV